MGSTADRVRAAAASAATSVAAAAVLASAVIAGLPATAGAAPGDPCPPPVVTDGGTRIDSVANGNPHGGGTGPVPDRITHPGVDTDDDGSADTISLDGTSLVIERGDGTVTLTDAPAGSGQPAFVGTEGADLDGDGRDELFASVGTPVGYPGIVTTWVIPGTVATGTHPFADEVFSFTGYITGDTVGDDGIDDALVYGQALSGQGFPRLPDAMASLVGLFDARPWAFKTSTDRIARRTDLDLDGLPDTIYLNRVRGLGQPPTAEVDLSATGPLILSEEGGWPSATVEREGSRTFVAVRSALLFSVVTDRRWLHLTCAGPWIDELARLGLGRDATDADVGGMSRRADPDETYRRAASRHLFTSLDGRRFTVELRYVHILGRGADPSGYEFWSRAMLEGRRNTERLEGALYGSDEFAREFPDWIGEMYIVALRRTADPVGRAYWEAQATQHNHEYVARRFLASAAGRRERVQTLYNALLLRNATDAELTWGAAALRQFGGEDALIVGITSSDEFYLDAQHGGIADD
jgi:hypothetical protein